MEIGGGVSRWGSRSPLERGSWGRGSIQAGAEGESEVRHWAGADREGGRHGPV
jgi:hypothetical protein